MWKQTNKYGYKELNTNTGNTLYSDSSLGISNANIVLGNPTCFVNGGYLTVTIPETVYLVDRVGDMGNGIERNISVKFKIF